MAYVETLVSIIVPLGFGIGITYLFLRQTGVAKSIDNLLKEQIAKETKPGWGKAEFSRITKDELQSILKLGEKDKRTLWCGIRKIGVLRRFVEYNVAFKVKVGRKKEELPTTMICCEFIPTESGIGNRLISTIKKGSRSYIIFEDREVHHADNKNIYLNDNTIVNYGGIYYTAYEEELKRQFVDFLSYKNDLEDTRGRISNLASKVVYLDLRYAQELEKLSHITEAERVAKEKSQTVLE